MAVVSMMDGTGDNYQENTRPSWADGEDAIQKGSSPSEMISDAWVAAVV
jgi:hypothetical protein